MQERIDGAAAAVGRDPAEVRRIYNVPGRITDGTSGDEERHIERGASGWMTP